MTTPDPSPLGDAAEADVADLADQHRPIDDVDSDAWPDAQRVSSDRDWQASEADLIEQAIEVPLDESEPDRE
ncbi:hypothetical protein [Mycolicibacterium hippocampi]|uniref:DUF5709 domain-containing protein n=1 Tax=Mycolicibacterium hippocampi TaxID=659824 RepID=A0A850PDX4_9MYCO|nr:hypothetical protein [Mycolicibacterium hippocampi]NVN48358.1 hypothetical protein [Mycolicibacterium hippocampi]